MSRVAASNTIRITVAGSGPPPPPTSLRHFGLCFMENQDLATVLANSPYLKALGQQYATTTNYHGVDHPSWPNYSAQIAGSYFGINADPEPPSSKQLPYTTLVSLILKAGLSWKCYVQSLPSSCYLGSPQQPYAGHHVPFFYFTEVTKTAQCAQVVDFTELAADVLHGTLPDVFFIVPDNDHNDTHSDWSTGDAFLKNDVVAVLETLPDWSQTALFIDFDEPYKNGSEAPLSDPVYGTLVSPLARMGYASSKAYTHYNTLATLEAAIGQGNLGRNDATASPMADLFASGSVPPLVPG